MEFIAKFIENITKIESVITSGNRIIKSSQSSHIISRNKLTHNDYIILLLIDH